MCVTRHHLFEHHRYFCLLPIRNLSNIQRSSKIHNRKQLGSASPIFCAEPAILMLSVIPLFSWCALLVLILSHEQFAEFHLLQYVPHYFLCTFTTFLNFFVYFSPRAIIHKFSPHCPIRPHHKVRGIIQICRAIRVSGRPCSRVPLTGHQYCNYVPR